MKQITKRFTIKGYQARCKTKQDPTLVYVTWHNPDGCEINEWDNENVAIFEELLIKVRIWCATDDLLLWSY